VLGSMNFLRNKAIPTEKIAAMVNLDMVGRMKDNKLNIFGTGTSSKFASLADEIAAIDTVTIIKVEEAYTPSDNSSFNVQKIPSLFLFTGVHLDYHTPTDEEDKINYPGLEKVSRVLTTFVQKLASNPEKPDFKAIGSPTEGSLTPAPSSGHTSVSFGAVPDFEPNPNGFKLQGVTPGSPAEKAGIKGGDVLISMGDKRIKSIVDLSQALKSFKPGDKVPVKYLREGTEKTVEVTMVKK